LQQIFGEQTVEISQQLKVLDQAQVDRFESLQNEYVKGTLSIEEVRGKMLRVLGNDDRIVATQSGIYVRSTAGEKIKAISNNSKLTATQLLKREELPPRITDSASLSAFSWGIGMLEGEAVLFPWELTMSTFTKEIVENTARRTAEEFIKMGGGEKWTRPVYIELTVDESDKASITTKGNEDEVFVTTKKINSQTIGKP
jgi:hypothetical protein